jgi:hypothetical protein
VLDRLAWRSDSRWHEDTRTTVFFEGNNLRAGFRPDDWLVSENALRQIPCLWSPKGLLIVKEFIERTNPFVSLPLKELSIDAGGQLVSIDLFNPKLAQKVVIDFLGGDGILLDLG